MAVLFSDGSTLTPRQEARKTEVRKVEDVPTGLDGLWDTFLGWRASRPRRSADLWTRAGEIEGQREAVAELTDRELQEALQGIRQKVRRAGAGWKDLLAEALPPVAEAARRALGLNPYRTQLMGALGLAQGSLVEMATGEGKTLTIALAAAVAGWTGKPVHVITANDYLASRDAEELGKFYHLVGLEAAAVQAEVKGPERRRVYQADVVYCTGKELVADYLRDQIALGDLADSSRRAIARLAGARKVGRMTVLRGLCTAIVDEVDNQLIDEAVTPLIISREQANESLRDACLAADQAASGLLPGEHYEVDETHREIRLKAAGRDVVAAFCAQQTGFLSAVDWVADMVRSSLQARHFFLKDRQYVMVDGKVVIVDEFTGRLMPGRSWRLGLHQAVEAKEEVDLSSPNETLARLSFQKFYRFFHHLAGITGTAREARREFWRVYRLPFVEVPRHRPNQRQDWPTRFYPSREAKLADLCEEISTLHRANRPVLIGTRSVAASEDLAEALSARGLEATLLNAVRHQEEAGIIRLAGNAGRITIATNMAGRGTDIRLNKEARAAGGLHVILSEGHEAGRIDRQLMGRAGRQGDPGSTRIYSAREDDLWQRQARWGEKTLVRMLFKMVGGGNSRILRWFFRRLQRRAEKKAQRQRYLLIKQDSELTKNVMGNNAIHRNG